MTPKADIIMEVIVHSSTKGFGREEYIFIFDYYYYFENNSVVGVTLSDRKPI